jgi:hypothetical protein
MRLPRDRLRDLEFRLRFRRASGKAAGGFFHAMLADGIAKMLWTMSL